ncbi:MAG TPA: hypothetical protein VNZ64_04625, partial [Candidatus Acidoferrum sp.]|nr:hypothetical protein [Candidatus Acidoferrum sp.]
NDFSANGNNPLNFVSQSKGALHCPLPLQPHPPNQPDPTGEGTTLKPDISLATKTGHLHLLRTPGLALFAESF